MSPTLQDETVALLDHHSISYVKKPKKFQITVDRHMIEKSKEVMRSIAGLVKKSWLSDG